MDEPSPLRHRDSKLTGTALTAPLLLVCLTIAGCGIPGRRCAQPAAPMPQFYSWNNGVPFWDKQQILEPSKQESSEGSSDSDDQATEPTVPAKQAESTGQKTSEAACPLSTASDSIQLVSLVNPADNSVENASETSPEQLTPPAELSNPESLTNDTIVSVPNTLENSSLESSAQMPLAVFFDDPYLIGLIQQALTQNQELKILAEEIQIACNEAYARSGEYRPFVSFGAGAGIEKSSRFSRDGAVETQLEAAPGRGFPEPLPDFLVATNVTWELDIWKKLRNAQCAAAMRYLGTREGRNYVITRVVAEVAENYYELLALDNRLLTLAKTIEIQQRSLEVAQAKKDAGRGTELAVQRFEAEVRKNQSEILIIEQEIVEVENRINFLAGRYPQPVERMSAEYVDIKLSSLSAGMPAQLLRNRADIRQAEREVAAAGLDVKVARARFYPSLGLSAGVGLNAFNTRYLLSTPESLIYNATMDLVGPLINKRAIQADYRSANAAQLQSIYHYQRTVLNAYIEVVNYMTKVENYRQSIEVKKQQLEALEASVDSASKLFQNARAEYVEVLLAQREMMEARMVLIETKQQQLSAIVNAYQALGGGGL